MKRQCEHGINAYPKICNFVFFIVRQSGRWARGRSIETEASSASIGCSTGSTSTVMRKCFVLYEFLQGASMGRFSGMRPWYLVLVVKDQSEWNYFIQANCIITWCNIQGFGFGNPIQTPCTHSRMIYFFQGWHISHLFRTYNLDKETNRNYETLTLTRKEIQNMKLLPWQGKKSKKWNSKPWQGKKSKIWNSNLDKERNLTNETLTLTRKQIETMKLLPWQGKKSKIWNSNLDKETNRNYETLTLTRKEIQNMKLLPWQGKKSKKWNSKPWQGKKSKIWNSNLDKETNPKYETLTHRKEIQNMKL